jgi:endonuclease/exonuclease/phosphatase family metal-dependent hydrolase
LILAVSNLANNGLRELSRIASCLFPTIYNAPFAEASMPFQPPRAVRHFSPIGIEAGAVYNHESCPDSFLRLPAMKAILPSLPMLAMLLFGSALAADGPAPNGDSAAMLRVLTFNIRYNNPGDGPNAWPLRRDWVAEIIRERKTDLVGMQEALPGQIADLEERLPEYAWYGVGRDDGKHGGEHTPIFYRKDRLERLDQGAFWLSETPEKPGSKSWDTAITRVAVWLKLKDRKTGQTFFAFNTHFDHRGQEARRESAKLTLRKIHEIAGDAPVVLTGDFNGTPDSPPYKLLTAEPETDGAFRLRDAFSASANQPRGPTGTWNGFDRIVPGRRIDYILVTPMVQVVSHTTIDESRDERFPSDHLPVLAEVRVAAE